jgi:hypothetical protein
MKVYLCDPKHDTEWPSAWYSALLSSFPRMFQFSDTITKNEPPQDHPAYKDSNAILICHSTAETNWKKEADRQQCHFVLVRSGGQQRKESNARGNLHGCYWHPDDFNVTPRPARLRAWLDQINSGSPSANVQWSLLQPAPTERLWALRLLCEGFLDPETKAKLPPQWFKLLAPNGEPPDATIAAIEADAADLTDEGVTLSNIRALLNEIKDIGAGNETAAKAAECLSILEPLLGISIETSRAK